MSRIIICLHFISVHIIAFKYIAKVKIDVSNSYSTMYIEFVDIYYAIHGFLK